MAIIEAITKLRNSPELRSRLGALGYEDGLHNRNAATSFANAFAQIYRECRFRRVSIHSARNQLLRGEGAGVILVLCARN